MGSIASGILSLIYGNKAAGAQALGYNDALVGVEKANNQNRTDINNAGAASQGIVNQGAATATGQVNDAAKNATGQVWDATNQANTNIAGGLATQVGQQAPYLAAGQQGVKGLADLANEHRQFSWDPSQVANDPAYQFRLQQGKEAINNSAASRGLLSSGNTLKDLTSFGQGNAATYENQDFNQALSQFNTNFDTAQKSYLPLAQMGQTAVGQFDQATQNAQGQVAGNLINAGTYGGNASQYAGTYGGNATQNAAMFGGQTTNSLAEFLAKQNADTAISAGNYRVGQGNATAGKDLNTGGALGSIIGGVPSLYNAIAKIFTPGGSGNGDGGD